MAMEAAKDPMITVVLEVGMHCENCASQVIVCAQGFKGVETVTVDIDTNKLTVVGKVDPFQIQKYLSRKIKKKVDLVSPQPRKPDTTTTDNESRKKSDEERLSFDKVSLQHEIEDATTGNKDSDKNFIGNSMGPATMAVFNVPLHCDGCIKKIRKIIRRIRGVHEVRLSKEEETVTVIGTIDVKKLTETMKKRLEKLVPEQKIVIKNATSHYSFDKTAPKQVTSSQPPLQILVQNSESNQIISDHHLSDEGRNQNHSPVSSGEAHKKLDSEVGESSSTTIGGGRGGGCPPPPTRLTTSETTAWGFLIASLLLEGVSAVLDQLGHLLAGTVLAFVALLLSVFELVDMARRETHIAFDRRSDLPCYCYSINKPPSSEHFSVVHCFGFTCAVWQCLYSTVQYIYACRSLDNPIKMTLLPFIFLICVLISKTIRKLEESNCQNPNSARTGSCSYPSQFGDASLSRVELGHEDQRYEDSQILESPETISHGQTASEFGCSHYRRRCKIRAPCCNEIFCCWKCHNEAKNAVKNSPHDPHYLPVHEVVQVICSLCHIEQDVQQNCISCGVCMGEYFCSKCKFYDDDVSKNRYHCDECGICRTGGRENSFHCMKCGSCHPKLTQDANCCEEKAIRQE